MLLYSTNFHVGKEEESIKGNLTFFISTNDLIILRSGRCCKKYIKFKRERSRLVESASHFMVFCITCMSKALRIQWGHLFNLHAAGSVGQVASKEVAVSSTTSRFQQKLITSVLLHIPCDRTLQVFMQMSFSVYRKEGGGLYHLMWRE